MLSLADIELLFLRHGAEQYSGEPVTQLEHALQTAHFAEQSEALALRLFPHYRGHLRRGNTSFRPTDVVARAETGPPFREAALFTHKGMSGPAILQVSSYWRHGEEVGIDFFPDRSPDWPAGVVGSITHTRGLCSVVVVQPVFASQVSPPRAAVCTRSASSRRSNCRGT